MNYSELDLDEYIGPEDLIKHSEMALQLEARSFRVGDLGISYREVNNWAKQGLLVTTNEAGQWRKFNFIEYCWVQVVSEMRKFGAPVSMIRKTKEQLFEPLDMLVFMEIPEIARKVLEMLPDDMKEEGKKLVKNEEFWKEAGAGFKVNMFYLLVMDCLIVRSHLSLMVNQEGECIPFKETRLQHLFKIPEYVGFFHKSHLTISLTEILSDFIYEHDKEMVSGQLTLLTPQESEVLAIIRKNNLQSLLIKFDKKHEIDIVELTTEKKIDKAARFVDIIMSKGYQEIVVKTQDGKIAHCKNTRKIKVKK